MQIIYRLGLFFFFLASSQGWLVAGSQENLSWSEKRDLPSFSGKDAVFYGTPAGLWALTPEASGQKKVLFLSPRGTSWLESSNSSGDLLVVAGEEKKAMVFPSFADSTGPSRHAAWLKAGDGSLTSEPVTLSGVPGRIRAAAWLDGTFYFLQQSEGREGWYSWKSGSEAVRREDPPESSGQPVVVAHAGGVWCFRDRADGTAVLDLYRPKPVDGTSRRGWMACMRPPFSVLSVVPWGQSHLLVQARDGRVGWYSTVTDGWTFPANFQIPEGEALVRNGPTLQAWGAKGGRGIEVARKVKSLGWPDYIVIVLYFAAMAGIGIYFSRKQESAEEFALGNRKVKWWAAGVSLFATAASSISFMAIPAQAYASSLVFLIPVFFMVVGYFLQAHIMFPLLRRLEITSTYEYIEKRFSITLRMFASVQCILYQTFAKMAIVILIPSLAISATTGLDVKVSVLVMGVLTTIYTAIGGFEAVVWTDLIQTVMKLGGMLLISVLAILALPGGWGEFVDTNARYGRFEMVIPWGDLALPLVWYGILKVLTDALSYAGDQSLIQRVFSTPVTEVRRLTMLTVFCGILIAILANGMGLALFAYFHAHPEVLDPGMKNDQVMPLFTAQAVPPGLAGLIIACLFAAAMSTVAGGVNSVATLLSEDFYRRWWPGASARGRLWVMKGSSVIVGLVSTGVAWFLSQQTIPMLFRTWSEMAALFGVGVTGMFVLGMFTRRANSWGVGIGFLSSVLFMFWIKGTGWLHWTVWGSLAIFTCVGVGYFASFFFRGKSIGRGLTIFSS
jgi:SSS family transporter